MEIFYVSQSLSFSLLQLVLAASLGLLLGLERVYAHKTAGMRTYALVALAAALFVIVPKLFLADFATSLGLPIEQVSSAFNGIMRAVTGVITGIGFLGAGLIIFREQRVQNLTTAAGLWVTAGIGLAVGLGQITLALVATALVVIIMGGLTVIERQIKLSLLKGENVVKDTLDSTIPRTRQKKLLEYFHKHDRVTNADLQKHLKVSHATVVRYLDALEKIHIVEQVGKTGRSVYYSLKK